MHELSIVKGIIDLAEARAKENNAKSIESIQIVIGELAGIDRLAFDFAWKTATPSTMLRQSELIIEVIPGEGRCLECGSVFHLGALFEPCPVCSEYLVNVTRGKELKVKSLVINQN